MWQRYLQTSTTAGGLLARALGEKYLGIAWDHASYAPLLKNALAQLKGPMMKIGQILATVPDILPPEYVQEFLQLQSHAPSMNESFVKRRMQAELGTNWRSLFRAFDQKAFAAASLGQVHRAESLAGEKLACKLQYPCMREAVDHDLQQLGVLCKLYKTYGKALDTQDIQQEIRARLYEELDYQREAWHINLFTEILKEEEGISLPKIYPHLSTSCLLTMEYLPGSPFLSAQEQPLKERQHIARLLFRGWYLPFYHYGVLHGDPHLGNYTVSSKGVNLLDFGCVRIFTPSFAGAVLDLYNALRKDDKDLAVHAYETWGFKSMTQELLNILNMWARFLYGPLLEDRVRPLEENFSGHQGKSVAACVHEELRKQGGIRPPREFVFMDRAAVGIGSALIHLKVEMNWYQLFQELIQGFSLEKLEINQKTLKVM